MSYGGLTISDKYSIGTNVLVGGSATYTFPLSSSYAINVSAPQTITLPQIISGANIGTFVIFRNVGSAFNITFQVSGGTQLIYDLTNTGANSQLLLPSGTNSVTLCAMFVSSPFTYAWYVITKQ
jgi:hypothetical protein